MAISSAPKARKVFVSHSRAGRRAVLAIQTAHLPCAKSPFWWVTFREQTWVTSRERRSLPACCSPSSGLEGVFGPALPNTHHLGQRRPASQLERGVFSAFAL